MNTTVLPIVPKTIKVPFAILLREGKAKPNFYRGEGRDAVKSMNYVRALADWLERVLELKQGRHLDFSCLSNRVKKRICNTFKVTL
jgi:hypothetical protein